MTSRERHYIVFILAMNHNLNLITNKQYTNAKKKNNNKEFSTKKREGKGPVFFKNVSHEREKLDMLQIKEIKGNITTKYKTWL